MTQSAENAPVVGCPMCRERGSRCNRHPVDYDAIPCNADDQAVLHLGPVKGCGECAEAACGCYACIGDKPVREDGWLTVGMTRMIVCALCGNKRCPHGTDHRNACTGSNESGQEGSRYGTAVAACHTCGRDLPTEESADERTQARNLRTLRHEAETPMRGHDGECCIRAALTTEETR